MTRKGKFIGKAFSAFMPCQPAPSTLPPGDYRTLFRAEGWRAWAATVILKQEPVGLAAQRVEPIGAYFANNSAIFALLVPSPKGL